MTAGVYEILCTATGRSYIGHASNIAQRWSTHRVRARNCTHWNPIFQSTWNKYGEKYFEFYALEKVKDETERVRQETWWWLKFDNTMNIGPTGMLSRLGAKLTVEHKEKISASLIGNSHGQGYKHTDEAKAKIGAASVGNTHAANYWKRRRRNASNT